MHLRGAVLALTVTGAIFFELLLTESSIFTSSTSDVARFGTPAASTDIQAQGGYTSTALAAGAALQINQRTSVYCELGRHWASGGDTRVKSGLQASVGVKVRW